MNKYQEYLDRLSDLREGKMQIEREIAAVYREAKRDGVSVDNLKAKMKEDFQGLWEQSRQISKATIEKEKATTPPKELSEYRDGFEDVDRLQNDVDEGETPESNMLVSDLIRAK